MIKGYVAVVDRDLPLPKFDEDTCRKTIIRFLYHEDDFRLYISNYKATFLDDEDYPFKVK